MKTSSLFVILATLSALFSGAAQAGGRGRTFYYNPFHLLENPLGNPQATFHYDTPHSSDLEDAVALFEAHEFNRFKNRLVTRESYSVDTEAQKNVLRSILGVRAESPATPWFKFALALTPLPYAIEAALATNDLMSALPGSVTRTQGRLDSLIARGGKVYVVENIEPVASTWIYSRVIVYQVTLGTENIQVVLGASHLTAQIQ
jgi:hypothetical protein